MAGSLAVLIGLLAVDAGFAQGDSVAALVVAAIICAAAVRLIGENANVLMDRTPAEAREAAERAIAELGADIELSRLRLRESAGRYFADVVVTVPPGQAVVEGHQSANLIEAAVERRAAGQRRGRARRASPPRAGPARSHPRDRAGRAAGDGGARHHDLRAGRCGQRLAAPEVPRRSRPAARPSRSPTASSGRSARGPGVSAVQTHLEPLERTLTARAADVSADLRATREIERLVRERTGARSPSGSSCCRPTPVASCSSRSACSRGRVAVGRPPAGRRAGGGAAPAHPRHRRRGDSHRALSAKPGEATPRRRWKSAMVKDREKVEARWLSQGRRDAAQDRAPARRSHAALGSAQRPQRRWRLDHRARRRSPPPPSRRTSTLTLGASAKPELDEQRDRQPAGPHAVHAQPGDRAGHLLVQEQRMPETLAAADGRPRKARS